MIAMCSSTGARTGCISYDKVHETSVQDIKNCITLLVSLNLIHAQGHMDRLSINDNTSFRETMRSDSLKN